MNENFCPVCGEPLAMESINVAEGVALCRNCGRLSRLSEVAVSRRSIAEMLRQPPKGCWIRERGRDILVGATTRSVGGFFGALFGAVFWNGIVSVFLLFAAAGLYTNLVGPLPPWFPVPEMEEPMLLGMALFLCVFLIPFVAVGLLLVGGLLMSAAGKIEVSIGSREASVRTGLTTGFGYLAWRRRFDPSQVRRVELGTTSWPTGNQSNVVVVIEADCTVKVGSLLPEERRDWLQTVLRALLTTPNADKRQELLWAATQAARWT